MMTRKSLRILLVASLSTALLLLSGCSADEDKEPGAIQKATDAVAQKGVDYIKTPIDQAKKAQELSELHNKTVEDAASSRD